MATTWILVADRARARLFEDGAANHPLTEVADFLNPEGRGEAKAGADDRPARVHDHMGAGRHAVEPSTDEREKSIARFARALVDELARGRVGNRFEQLVLVAPPAFLGALRGELDRPLSAMLTHSIDKDLTRADAAAVAELLRGRPA